MLMFKTRLTDKKDQIIRISRGPQFKTPGGHFLAIIFLGILILLIFCIINKEFFYAGILLITDTILFSLVVDIHGIEVDTKVHRIRDYQSFLWFKTGKWTNINDYKTIYLSQNNVIVPTSEYSELSYDTFHYYNIRLVDEINNKEIFLAEYSNYYKARQISNYVAEATGLELKEVIKGNVRKIKQ